MLYTATAGRIKTSGMRKYTFENSEFGMRNKGAINVTVHYTLYIVHCFGGISLWKKFLRTLLMGGLYPSM